MEQMHGDDDNTRAWLAWARRHVARLDPLASPPTHPPEREITAEDLGPYLPSGWSPHGPEPPRRW
jgi:hypothetical protein